MTAAAPVTHPHGTYRRYCAGCKCDMCRQAEWRWMKAYAADVHANGPRLSSADLARQLIADATRAGWSLGAVAAASGIPRRHLQHITAGGTRTVQRKTIAALQSMDLWAVTGPHRGPAWPAKRRLQALKALGWTWAQIGDTSRRLGYKTKGEGFKDLVNTDRPQISADMRHTVDAIYQHMHMTVPPAGKYRDKTVSDARKAGYAPPLAWDNIDDPDGRPHGVRKPRTRIYASADEIVDACETFHSINVAAERLGVARDTVRQALQRAGRRDLWDRLWAAEQAGAAA
jgi:hypothetical protein